MVLLLFPTYRYCCGLEGNGLMCYSFFIFRLWCVFPVFTCSSEEKLPIVFWIVLQFLVCCIWNRTYKYLDLFHVLYMGFTLLQLCVPSFLTVPNCRCFWRGRTRSGQCSAPWCGRRGQSVSTPVASDVYSLRTMSIMKSWRLHMRVRLRKDCRSCCRLRWVLVLFYRCLWKIGVHSLSAFEVILGD